MADNTPPDRESALRRRQPYQDIFKANQDVLTNPDKIKVGQRLRLS